MSRTRQLVTYATLIVLSACIWIFSSLFGLLDGVEQEALRWRYLVRGEMPSKAPIKFVNVDPLTVAKMGDKPWDRQNFARTVHALFGPGKARAVGIDIVFSPMGTGSLLDVDEAKKGDQRFGDAVEQNADRLILAAAYTGTTNKLKGVLPLRRYDYHDPAEVPFPETPTFPIVKYDYRRFGIANVDEALNKGQVPYKVPAIFESEGQDFSLHLID
ncbi:MAG: CHASE2 domain-containing protein, partial [Opitutales bacterium]